MKEAIIAASYDPITIGHINIIDRALKVFDRVLIAIGVNPQKHYTFNLYEREMLVKQVLNTYGERIKVKSFQGLLANFAYENQISTIIRGVRNTTDFDFERMLADINQGFKTGLETYILVADQSLSHISSSAAKELQQNQAKNVIEYVPPIVKQALEIRVSGQFLVGIAGGIGSGKSYVTKQLGFPYIDMDEVGRYILRESDEPVHKTVRGIIASAFGQDMLVDGKIAVDRLLTLMFDDIGAHSVRPEFEKIMFEPMIHQIKKQLLRLKGIILINSALFVKLGICSLVNNNFILVTCSEETREKRLAKRGYRPQQINNRIRAQLTPEEEIKTIQQRIKKESCGHLIVHQNENQTDACKLRLEVEELYSNFFER